jgi:secreted trypsin-like serine protease
MMPLIARIKLAGVMAGLLTSGSFGLPHVQHRRITAHKAVIGGVPAQTRAFASVVEVVDVSGDKGGRCTGTVVAPTLILTAGHCAEDTKTGVVNPASGYRVLIGGVGAAGVQRQVLSVFAVIVYDGFNRRTADGDAALLVLSAPTAAPEITVPTSSQGGELQAGTTALIAGWGRTYYEQQRPTEQLRSADTVVQGPRWCSRNARPFYVGSEICTIDPPSYQTGGCLGDSGGPLLAPQGAGGELVQIGITSHGYGKCSTRRPSVFTGVEPIAGWLHTWIDAYKPPPEPQAP